MSRPRVLVTGAPGMLGHALCPALASSSDVIRISKTGREDSASCDLSSLNDLSLCFDRHRPDVVINTAAYSDVDGCERNPELAYASNAVAVKNLSTLCGRSGAALIHISTDYVFSGSNSSPYRETDATGPVNIYGLSKLIGESYAHQCQAPCAIVRTSWLFGPGNPLTFVNAIAARLKTDQEVAVLDDQTDAPTYTVDLSAALILVMERLLSQRGGKKYTGAAEVYHVCNSGATTRYDMTVKIKEFLGLEKVNVLKTEHSQIKGRLAVRPPYAVMSNQLFEKTFGITLRRWEDSLREYLQETR